MTHVLDWKRADDPRDVVHLAVQALAEGHLVGLPTDTLYNVAVSGLHEAAIPKLQALRCRNPHARPTLALRSAMEIDDFCPALSPVAKRLANCLWPGPLGLVLDGKHRDSLVHRLPEACRETLLDADGRITLRIPAHDAIEHVMHLLAGPLLLLAAPAQSDKQPTTAEAVQLPEVALAIDDGVTHYQGPSTCVHVDHQECRIVSPGVLDQKALIAMSQYLILIVCTGNTCRSPMAERLLQAKFMKRFQDRVQPNRPAPFLVKSAGVSAMPGSEASPQAVAAMQSYGLELQDHQSTPVSERLLKRADLVLTMTANHRHAILSRWPELESKTHLLSTDHRDISDPFGGSVEVYKACAQQIDRYLDQWIERIPMDALAEWP